MKELIGEVQSLKPGRYTVDYNRAQTPNAPSKSSILFLLKVDVDGYLTYWAMRYPVSTFWLSREVVLEPLESGGQFHLNYPIFYWGDTNPPVTDIEITLQSSDPVELEDIAHCPFQGLVWQATIPNDSTGANGYLLDAGEPLPSPGTFQWQNAGQKGYFIFRGRV